MDDEHDPEQDRREQDGDLDGRQPLRATEPPAHSSAAWLLGGGDVVGIALRSGIDDAEHDDRGADEQEGDDGHFGGGHATFVTGIYAEARAAVVEEHPGVRSAERRVGKGWGSKYRSRWSPDY